MSKLSTSMNFLKAVNQKVEIKMTTIEEVLDSWMKRIPNAISNPPTFFQHYQSISTMLISLSQAGFLPEPYIFQSQFFLERIIPNILNQLLNKTPNNESEFSIMKDLIMMFIQFSYYGIQSLEKIPIQIAYILLNNNESRLFNSPIAKKRFLDTEVANAFLKMNITDRLDCLLLNQVQSSEILKFIIAIYSKVAYFIPSFNPTLFFKNSYHAISYAISIDTDIKDITVSLIYLLQTLIHAIESVSNNFGIEHLHTFFESFLPLLTPFLQSEQFDQRISVLNYLDNILSEKKYSKEIKEDIATFFLTNGNLSLLTNLKFHSAYKTALCKIFNALSTAQLTKENINSLWDIRLHLSSSNYSSFFECFLHLSDGANEYCVLKYLLQCILQDNCDTKDAINFFDHIDFIVENILKHKQYSVKELIHMIREKLRETAFNPDLDPIVIERSRQTLAKIITFEADNDDFDALVNELNQTNDPFIYILLNEILKDESFSVPQNQLALLIDQTMKSIIEDDSANKNLLCDFFLSLERHANTYINITQILSLYNSIPNFFSFLFQLTQSNSFNFNDFELIVQEIPNESFDMAFYKFIKFVIYHDNELNDSNLKALPIKHEDVLWSLATKSSNIKEKVARFLCKVYSLNDGDSLDDENMIKMFLAKWISNFSQDSENNSFLELLKQFIIRIERQTIRDISVPLPHEYFEHGITVFVKINQQSLKLEVPYFAEIGMVIEKISIDQFIPMNSFYLCRDGYKLRRSQRVSDFDDRNFSIPSVNLELTWREKKSQWQYHHRTAFPSLIIMNEPMIPLENLFEQLKENNKSAYALFQALPQLPQSTHFNNDEPIDQIFNPNKPLLFFYNLQTLMVEKNMYIIINNFHLIDYFYENIHVLFESMAALNQDEPNTFYIAVNNVKLHPNYQLIFLFMLFLKKLSDVQDSQSIQKVYYMFVKCAYELLNYSRRQFDQAIDWIAKFTSSKSIRIGFQEGEFHTIFDQLLMHSNCEIRFECVKIFTILSIPLPVFIEALSKYGTKISSEYLTVLNQHFNEYQNHKEKEELASVILPLLESARGHFLGSLLAIVFNLLTYNMLSNNHKTIILDFLMNRFLTFEYDKNDQIAFITASECMSLLSRRESNGELILKNRLKMFHESEELKQIEFTRFDIDGDSCHISAYNRVGLKNLNMTCYLNATLQQLFALKPVRYAIMSYDGEDPFLKELAKLFYMMRKYKGKVVSPASLIQLWYIGPNETLDPRIQQDAAEILQNLFLMFEKDKTLNDSINQFLQGDFVNQFDGIKEDYHTERNETFKTLELGVNKLPDLQHSFEDFIKPESFINNSQYYAEELGRKIDINRTIYIKTPPPILIIHLMRFEFNFFINQRTKITNPFVISKDIDISPLCLNKTDEEIYYRLIGVIIHKGQAEAGHYVSFVYQKKRQIWLCFDDENVTPISENDVLQEASGYRENSTGYILFYERVVKDTETNTFDYITNRMEIKKPDVIPEDIKKEIEVANKRSEKSWLMCSKGYFVLMDRLTRGTSLDYLDICLEYSIDTLPYCVHATESNAMYQCLSLKIEKADMELKNKFVNLLLHSSKLQTLLMITPHLFVRKGIADLIIQCFSQKCDLDPIPVVDSISSFIDCCLNYYTQIGPMFKVLNILYQQFEAVRKFALENEWPKKMCSVFDIGFKNFLAGNPGIKAVYIFEGIQLTHFLYLLIDFDLIKKKEKVENDNEDEIIDNDYVHYIYEIEGHENQKYALYFDQFVSPVLSLSFLIHLCRSLSSIKSVAAFIKKYHSPLYFKSCLQNKQFTVKPFRIVSILFNVFQSDAMQCFFELPFVNGDHLLTSVEQVSILIGIVYKYADVTPPSSKDDDIQQDIFVDSIVTWSNKWIPMYLYDDNIDTRQNCVALCGYLVACNVFNDNFLQVDAPDDLDIPDVSCETLYPIHSKSKSIMEKFLRVCFETEPLLSSKIVDSYQRNQGNQLAQYDEDELSDQFITLVSILLHAVKPEDNDYSPLSDLYSTLATSSFELFNSQMRDLINLINKFSIDIDFNILMLPFRNNTVIFRAESNDIDCMNSLCHFLPSFLNVFQQTDLKHIENCKLKLLIENESIDTNEIKVPEEMMLPIPDIFIQIFFEVFMFNSSLLSASGYINGCLQHLIKTRASIREKLSLFISKELEKLCRLNPIEVIISLKLLEEENPQILDVVISNIEKNPSNNVNYLISNVLEVSSATTIKSEKLEWLLQNKNLDETTIQLLQSLEKE